VIILNLTLGLIFHEISVNLGINLGPNPRCLKLTLTQNPRRLSLNLSPSYRKCVDIEQFLLLTYFPER